MTKPWYYASEQGCNSLLQSVDICRSYGIKIMKKHQSDNRWTPRIKNNEVAFLPVQCPHATINANSSKQQSLG